MSVNIKSNPDGVSGAIQVNGVDAFTFDNTGIKTGVPTPEVTASSTTTLTNKTIDYSSNTLTGVQPALVSGTNIKTIGNESILGSGDINISSPYLEPTELLVGGGSYEGFGLYRISDNKFIQVYGPENQTGGASFFTRIVNFNSSGKVSSTGSEVTVGVSGGFVHVLALSETKALLTYHTGGTSRTYRVASISGNTITLGTAATVSVASIASGIPACVIDTDKVLAVRYTSSGTLSLHVLSVSGTTISVGTDLSFSGTDRRYQLYQIDTNKAVLSRDTGSTAVAAIANVSGTTVTVGADFTYSSGSATANNSRILPLNSTTVLGLFTNAVSTNGHQALGYRVMSVSGSTISSSQLATKQKITNPVDPALSFPFLIDNARIGVIVDPMKTIIPGYSSSSSSQNDNYHLMVFNFVNNLIDSVSIKEIYKSGDYSARVVAKLSDNKFLLSTSLVLIASGSTNHYTELTQFGV